MKKITFLLSLFILGFLSNSEAQVQFWSDNFEDAGAPSSGTRTPSVSYSCGAPATSYFNRTDGAGISTISGTYTGVEGTKFWAGEDIDFGPTCVNASISPNQQVSWSIPITGKTGLSFKGLFAANNSFASNWEGSAFAPNQDFVAFEYNIDGAAWTKAIVFYTSTTSQSQTLKLETTGDLIGDGADLTYTFTEYSATIVGTGTTLNVRLNVSANNSATEEIAVDNFRLFETPSCTAPIITSNPPNRTICANANTTFFSSASGATAYQWQLNSGSGFGNITNGGVYSGATSTTLTITGATAVMGGYQYRCVAINGVASCFTNSNAGTLNVSVINTSSWTKTNVSCFGSSNGSATVFPSGGFGGYTYSWSPSGGTGATASGLSQGNYTVTVTDGISCATTQAFTITQPTSPVSGTTVVTNIACFGGNTGAINLTPTGGSGGFTFNWLPSGPTTEDRTGLVAGTYSVQMTDVNGCVGTVTAMVTQPTSPVSGTTVVTNVACFGGSNGAINLTPNGGTGPYTFNWLPSGPTTEDRSGLVAGTYTVQVTDANACVATVTASVTQPTTPVSGTTVVTNVACFGGNTGAINLTPTGGTGPYTFNWLPSGPGTEDRTGLIAGTYSVQITDVNGCVATVTATTTQPTSPVSGTTVVTNVACFGGNTGAINLTPTGGTGPYTFNWLPSGPGTEDRTGLIAGTYSVQIIDVNGCVATVTATTTQPTSPVSGTTVVTNVACFGGSNGAINLTPNGGTGPYTFNWLPSGPTTEDRTGLIAGTYSVQITDVNGCVATVTATTTQSTSPVSGTTVVTNVACFGGSNGAINLTPNGGTGPYTFNWLPSGPTTEDRTGLIAGTYSVQITDVNGCVATVTASVTAPSAISFTAASQTNVACFGGSNGAAAMNAAIGGTGTMTYDWTPGTPTGDGTTSVTGLTAGSWTCTATDANGCIASQVFTVTEPSQISFTAASQTDVSCFGGSNGAFQVNTAFGGTGAFTYDWTPGNPTGDGTTSVNGLTAGTWTSTATDANGCTALINFTITEPSQISFTAASQTNVSCFGGSTGAAGMNAATGGAGGYTYDWTPGTPTGDGTNLITGLTAGSWTCTVTDANGCTASQIFIVTEPSAISFSATSQTDVVCNGTSAGSASGTITGGTTPYDYSWMPTGGNGSTANGLPAGTYTLFVNDANGCTTSNSYTITESAAVVSSLTETACSSFTLNGTTYTIGGTYTQVLAGASTMGCDSTITLNLIINQPSVSTLNETACSSYTLNGNTYTASGTYTQQLINAAGCDSTITLNLTVNQPSISTLNETACSSFTLNGTTYSTSGIYTQVLTNLAGCDSTLTLNLTINQPSTSSLTETACSSYTLNGTTYSTSGTYTQMLTNAAGCDSTITLNLTINQPTVSSLTETACSSFTLNGITYTTGGTYTQMLTNAAGCDSTLTLNLVINNPDATVTVSGETITANASVVSYQWIDCNTGLSIAGETNQSFTATVNGSYAVIITDGSCSDTSACETISTIGVREQTKTSMEASVFPNPFSANVSVILSNAELNSSIEIIDGLGQIVYTSEVNSRAFELDLNKLENGVYYLKIKNGENTTIKRLVRQN